MNVNIQAILADETIEIIAETKRGIATNNAGIFSKISIIFNYHPVHIRDDYPLFLRTIIFFLQSN